MLPPSIVKGGTAMNLRFDETASRFIPHLDAPRWSNERAHDLVDLQILELEETRHSNGRCDLGTALRSAL